MAQKSKKDHIVQTASPLFLHNGFKGTSIDLIVKQSGVSKPTVYNHFPDKSALMYAVVEYWILDRQLKLASVTDDSSMDEIIENIWLSSDTVLFYALIIGEGRRFSAASKLFWLSFDSVWRDRIISWGGNLGDKETTELACQLDHRLLNRLRSL